MTLARTSVVRYAVALATCAVLVAPFAAGALPTDTPYACGVPNQFQVSDSWKVSKGPIWKTGPNAISHYTWDSYDSDNLYVTNGAEVQVSHDGGCHWKQSYALPSSIAGGFSSSDSTIVDLQVPESSAAGDDVYALVDQTVQALHRPHVVVSRDGGKSWQVNDDGLAATGRPIAIRPAPLHPATVYVALDVNGAAIDLIYVSTDSGESWSLRSDLTKAQRDTPITDLRVDPQDPDLLWAPGPNGLYDSTDGGRSFEANPYFQNNTRALPTGPVDVFHAPEEQARIATFMPGQRVWYRSLTGGVGWSNLSLRGLYGQVDSVAHGPSKDIMLATAGGRAYAWNEPTKSWASLDAPVSGLHGMIAGRGSTPIFSGHTTTTIETYFGRVSNLITTLPPSLIDVPSIANGDTPVSHPPVLAPKTRKVVIDPGRSKTVPFRLKLPSRPLPLDVYFLLDTSASTTAFLQNVARSVATIANELRSSGIYVRYGLADYRAYPNRFPPAQDCGPGQKANEDKCEANYVYRRDLDLAFDNGPELAEALESLTPDGGGAYRSMYSALFHSVSGEGEDLGQPGDNPTDHDLPPGQQAHFAEDAVKIIVHATDESFADEDNVPPPNPTDPASLNRPDMITQTQAEDALNAFGVYQVGISTGSESLKDLKTMAAATGAIAPPQGIDCNGDGAVDVPGGEPLVCSVNPNQSAQAAGIVPGIKDLLRGAVPFKSTVSLDLSGGREVVDEVTPSIVEDVILQTQKSLTFDVTFHCPADDAGKRFRVGLKAPLESMTDPKASATVVCRAIPKKPPVAPLSLPPAAPAAAALVALAAPPPPPPPPPVIELSSASQSQSQAQAQAQAGMAYQEETQPQTAFVAAFHDEPEADFAFSSYRQKSDSLVTPVTVLGAGAVLLSFAFGFMTLGRELAREKVLNRRN